MNGVGGPLDVGGGWECRDDRCVTCSDAGEPMRVVAVDGQRELALCAGADGKRRTVEIALVAPVEPDDELLVHAGTAIAALGPREAAG